MKIDPHNKPTKEMSFDEYLKIINEEDLHILHELEIESVIDTISSY